MNAVHEIPPIPTEPVRNIKIGFAERENEETPTQASNSFLARSIAIVGLGGNLVGAAISGNLVGEGIAYGDQRKIILGAVAVGLNLAGVNLSARVLK